MQKKSVNILNIIQTKKFNIEANNSFKLKENQKNNLIKEKVFFIDKKYNDILLYILIQIDKNLNNLDYSFKLNYENISVESVVNLIHKYINYIKGVFISKFRLKVIVKVIIF